MKASERKDMIAATLVLLLICLVITAALAVTYQITKPIIDEINIINANIARGEVFAEGEGSFSPVEGESGANILEVYEANNGTGYVFTALDKGFGGKLTVMVGISKSGEVTGVKVTGHAETPGLGTKAMTPDYLAQYSGQIAVTRSDEADKTQIDAVTGATVTSNAVFRAVETALEQFKQLGGAN